MKDESMRRILPLLVLLLAVPLATAQLPLDPLTKPAPSANPFTNPGLTPQAAFAKWFAPDAVTLSNGKAPVIGQVAIAASANWTPGQYQLTWTPEGGRMS